MKKILNKFAIVMTVMFPWIASAQTTFKSAVKGVTDAVWGGGGSGGALMSLLFSAALALFLWGVVEFIRNAENSDARTRGKQRMLWGIIALFAMISYIGLTGVLTQSVFNDSPFLPQLFTK